MGFFDFLKKKEQNKASDPPRLKIAFTETVNGKTSQVEAQTPPNAGDTSPTDFEHLTKEGDLPFGWIYRNKEFTDKIQSEYSYFLNLWLDSRSGSPKEQYAALKSFVLYLEDAEKICISKGECFEFWFYEIIASADYIDKRKNELLKMNDPERR